MIRKSAIAIIVLLATVSMCFAGGPSFKEGKWEITTKMEMPGMPMEMPAFTHTQCMTQEDFVPDSSQQQQQGDGNCEPVKVKTSGNTVTWSIKCKSEEGGVVTGDGTMTYKKDSFTGSMKMNQNGMAMTMKMTGKYIGKCER